MKTTVEIDDELLKAAKRAAIDEGVTLRQLIEEGLRHRMALGCFQAPRRAETSAVLDDLERAFAEARQRLASERPYGTFEERGDLYEPVSKIMDEIHQAAQEFEELKNGGPR